MEVRQGANARDVKGYDTERDNYMSAEEALEYGLIDAVITKPVQ